MTLDTPQVIGRAAGDHFHFLNQLAVNKVAGDESGTMSVVEFFSPAGFAPPVHSHRYEDELLVVLDGEIDILVGDEHRTTCSGELAFLPHGVPHSFVVQSEFARYLSVTTARSRVPEFDAFVADMGTPTTTAELPEPVPVDGALVADISRSHGIDVLGPPPV